MSGFLEGFATGALERISTEMDKREAADAAAAKRLMDLNILGTKQKIINDARLSRETALAEKKKQLETQTENEKAKLSSSYLSNIDAAFTAARQQYPNDLNAQNTFAFARIAKSNIPGDAVKQYFDTGKDRIAADPVAANIMNKNKALGTGRGTQEAVRESIPQNTIDITAKRPELKAAGIYEPIESLRKFDNLQDTTGKLRDMIAANPNVVNAFADIQAKASAAIENLANATDSGLAQEIFRDIQGLFTPEALDKEAATKGLSGDLREDLGKFGILYGRLVANSIPILTPEQGTRVSDSEREFASNQLGNIKDLILFKDPVAFRGSLDQLDTELLRSGSKLANDLYNTKFVRIDNVEVPLGYETLEREMPKFFTKGEPSQKAMSMQEAREKYLGRK